MDSTEQRIMDSREDEIFGVRITYPSTISFSHRFSATEGFCACMYDYLTYNNSEIEPTYEEKVIRSLVFNFKKGECPGFIAMLFSKAIKQEPMLGYIPAETVLAVIPASTAEKHRKRFEEFSYKLSDMLGIINGYSLLQVSTDRTTDKEHRHISLADCITLSDPEGLLKGKLVFLVDDVYTTGSSFRTVAKLLTEAGAKSVTGLFLAQSVPHTKQERK